MGGYQIDLRRAMHTAAVRASKHRGYSASVIAVLVSLSVLALVGSPFRSGAETTVLYPVMCTGDWQSPSLVQGTPVSDELVSSFFERSESSSRPDGHDSRIFCSFAPETDDSRVVERLVLTFVFAVGSLGDSALTDTATHASEESIPDGDEDASSVTADTDPVEESADLEPVDEQGGGIQEPVEQTESAETENDAPPEADADESSLETTESAPSAMSPVSALLAALTEHAYAEEVSESATSSDEATSTPEIETQESARVAVLRFSYTTDGEIWRDLGGVDVITEEVSFEMPILTEEEMKTLVVRVIADGVFDTPVYLEGIRLAMTYARTESGDEASGGALIGVNPQIVEMPDFDDFTMPRVIAFDSTIAAILSNTDTQALFVFRYDDFGSARLVAYAADMAPDSPIASKDGRLYWLGREHIAVGFDPRFDTYYSSLLVQSTTTPGALEAAFGPDVHTVIVQDGRISFRDAESILASDDEPAVRDAFLKTYFASAERTTVSIGFAGSGASILDAAQSSTTAEIDAPPATSALASVAVAVENFFKRALFSREEARHTCRIEPFRIDVSRERGGNSLVQLILESEKEYVLETDALPHGMTIGFGPENAAQFRILPGWSEPVPLSVALAPDARVGDFTVPIFLTSVDEPKIATSCKVNIANL